MSKWSTFFRIAGTVGVQALKLTPLAPIADPVAIAIAEAQQIEGASGAEKLAHVTNIAIDAANAANAQAGHQVIDPAQIAATAQHAISTTYDAIKLIHDAHQQQPLIPAA